MLIALIVAVVAAAFVTWDRRSPASADPDTRMIAIGTAFAVVGLIGTIFLWWLIVPVVLLLAGALMIVVGRHRTRVAKR
jgi:small neutral amino acid transporter SnatA (MarC family)